MAKKEDLIKSVVELNKGKDISLTKKETEEVIASVIDSIIGLTAEDGKLQLTGFGSFEVREREARKGRNPQTGEEIDIPASKSVKFKAGKDFKEFIK